MVFGGICIQLNYNWSYLWKDLVTQSISIQKRKNVQDFTLDDDQKPKVELQEDGAGDNIFWETDFDNIEEMK